MRLDFDCDVDWDEKHKLLKVQFPVNIRSPVATYEIPYGHIQRPTHFNTSHDFAKFEVCGHRFADLSEYGYGVALLNDCKYGYSVHNNLMRMSLLRAPKAPDANCDIGRHHFKYALLPHPNSFLESDVVNEGIRFNVPLLTRIVPQLVQESECVRVGGSVFSANQRNIVIDCVKREEDSDSVIVRMYEAYGGRGKCQLKCAVPIAVSAMQCNILEDELTKLSCETQDGVMVVTFDYHPFQVVTVKLKRAK